MAIKCNPKIQNLVGCLMYEREQKDRFGISQKKFSLHDGCIMAYKLLCFSSFGITYIFVSDHGRQFDSIEFKVAIWNCE